MTSTPADVPADFRSDTMTAPTSQMRQAMADAAVGDDVWGEDPTVRELEQAGAEVLGKQAALYLPSGTMANQVAIHVHCRSGDELICEERSHVFYYEGGAIAGLSGTQVRTLVAADGFPTAAQVENAVRADDPHFPRSRLLVVENTHNMAGGRVASAERIAALAAVARRHGMAVHCDGARLMNAAVALAVPAHELVAEVDSTTLCLSKGLGAPVGSLMVASQAAIDEARVRRKRLGGGMRQVGVLAAAGLHALDHHVERLSEDHEHARLLAEACGADPATVETNIVVVARPDAPAFVAAAREAGVAISAVGPRTVRLVTHLDVSRSDAERAAQALAGL